MIIDSSHPVKRTKLRVFRPSDRPQPIACFTFMDPRLGVVARSERSQSGILSKPSAIAWDAGIIDQLARHNVSWLEVFVVDFSHLYTCPLQRFFTHAWPLRGQLILGLEHWNFFSKTVTVHVDSEPEPSPQQMNLFEAPNDN